MVYNDGTDDEPLDFRVIMPNGRVVYSNPENIMFVGERKKHVERPVEKKEDDLSKYYDYDCDQSDQLDGVEKTEEVDIDTIYARIVFGALSVAFVSGSIGIGIESGILLGIAILSFVVMFIFALMSNRKDDCK